MSETIQNPIVGANLREFFRLVGSVRPEIEDSVVANVLVGDLSAGAPPPRRRHAAATIAAVAAAGQVNAFFFRSADKSTLARITDIFAFGAAADQMRIRFTDEITLGMETEGTRGFTDQRVRLGTGPTQQPSYILSSQSRAGVFTGVARYLVPALASGVALHLQPKGWVLGLGPADASQSTNAMTIESDTVNGTMVLGIEWDEYQLP